MTTYRINKREQYFIASNHVINDGRLSWEARGVLMYLLSKPDGWIVRNKDIENGGNAGRDKVRRIIKELQKCGYLHRQRIQMSNGQYDWMTEVYEQPYTENPPPSTENPSTVNTSIYKELNKKEFISEKKDTVTR